MTSAPDKQSVSPLPARRLLATYLGPQWPRALVLVLLLVVTIGLRLGTPQILRAFIDQAAGGAAMGALVRVALLFLGAGVLLQLCSVAEVYVAENVGLTATNALRADLTLHVLRLDPPFHAAHTPGELIERTDGDVATLGNFFSRLIVYIFGNALLLLGMLLLLAQIDLRIGAAAGLCAAAGVGTAMWLRRLALPRFTALRQANADLFGLIEERLAGTEDVRANGGNGYVLRRLLERSRHLLWADITTRLTASSTVQSAFLFLELATAATLAIGAWLYRRQELSIGTVYLIFAYTQSLYQPLSAIMRQIQDLQQAAASIGRVQRLLGERSALVSGWGAATAAAHPLAGPQPAGLPPAGPPPGPLSVELDHVTFAYDGGEPALRDVSLRLEPGQMLGLLGRTGSGKTTLARLLFRLYDPQQGALRLGDIDLREPNLDELRTRIGFVTQDVQVFHATARDNVTLFDRSVPDTRIVEVLHDLGLDPWLSGLRHGLDTKLAPAGGGGGPSSGGGGPSRGGGGPSRGGGGPSSGWAIGLSAGEAQLLAFARAFLKDPGLVVLDEASSRLDPATERLLERAVDRLLERRTAIVIAHRLATVGRADRIVILERGQVAEAGERAALVADPDSRFSQLLRAGLEEVLA